MTNKASVYNDLRHQILDLMYYINKVEKKHKKDNKVIYEDVMKEYLNIEKRFRNLLDNMHELILIDENIKGDNG